MEGGALLSDEFKAFSEKYVMFLHVTTHIEGRKNDDLLGKVGGRGFPSFFVFDHSGMKVGASAGRPSVAGFEGTMKKAQEFVDLKAKAEAGDAAAKVKYTLGLAKMGKFKAGELKAEMKKLGKISDEDQKEYNGVLASLMVAEIKATAVGKALVDMDKKGLVPTDDQERGMFYYDIWRYAQYAKDISLMEKALKGMQDGWANSRNPNIKRFLESAPAMLEKAKAEAK